MVVATDVKPFHGELAISAITLAELHFGVLVASQQKVRSKRLRRLTVLQRNFDTLPVDDAVVAGYCHGGGSGGRGGTPATSAIDGPADRDGRPRSLRPALHLLHLMDLPRWMVRGRRGQDHACRELIAVLAEPCEVVSWQRARVATSRAGVPPRDAAQAMTPSAIAGTAAPVGGVDAGCG